MTDQFVMAFGVFMIVAAWLNLLVWLALLFAVIVWILRD